MSAYLKYTKIENILDVHHMLNGQWNFDIVIQWNTIQLLKEKPIVEFLGKWVEIENNDTE